jgi:uroporphyrinogen-III synthase
MATSKTTEEGQAPKDATSASKGFGGARVVTFESRRAAEMASLVERHGGAPVTAPALREVSIGQNETALSFARTLRQRAFDVVVLMTGTGTRALADEVAPEMDREAFARSLTPSGEPPTPRLVVRGPKPAGALRELGIRDFITVPEPNTWREVFAALEAQGPLAGAKVAVQEHGAPSVELYEALAGAGAVVTPVPVYKWALPEDTAPLRRALGELARGEAKVALFTSRTQVEHAFVVAAEEGLAEALRESLRRGLVGSIGPVCSEALRAEGLPPDVEPEHPKMGHLVKEAAARASAVVAGKRGVPVE